MRMFEAIGVAERLAGKGCPIQGIRVSDGLAPGKLDFEPGGGETALGHMFENRILRSALFDERLRRRRGRSPDADPANQVERGEHGVTATLSNGAQVRAPLLIAAEGRNSPTREAAGLG
jgi:2-octaprenyl-6-methoxyphenol hydroxylase